MTNLTLRSVKGSPLTNNEVDTNFSNLDSDKVEQTAPTGSIKAPSGTTAQRDGAPINGYFRYNATSHSFEGYINGGWSDIGLTYSAGNGIGLTGTTFSVAAGGGLTQDANGLSHTDTSTQTSLTALTGANVVSDIDLDTYGHVTALATRALTAGDIGAAEAGHNHTLDSLSNVTITTNSSGEILKWSGTAWINNTLAEAGIQPAGSYLTGNETITLSGDVTGSGTTAITTSIAANVVGAAELNVTGNGTTSQYLRSDGDGTFTWATPPNTTYTGGDGLTLTGTDFDIDLTDTLIFTSTNTANRAVVRDASGNFSAGTITATLSGNATSASSVTNAATFNNGGAGAASGTTFDGSVARTISYNTVGASPLAGSTSLVTTGTVTTGTWSGSFGSVSGANLTSLTAANISSGNLGSGVLPYATVNTAASEYKIPFLNTTGTASGNFGLLHDTEATFTYNPSTNTVTAGTFLGNSITLTGDADTESTIITNTGTDFIINAQAGAVPADIRFQVASANDADALRLRNDGAFLVNTTSEVVYDDSAGEGWIRNAYVFSPTNSRAMQVRVYNGEALALNRMGSIPHGDMVTLYKDGVLLASMGTESTNNFYFDNELGSDIKFKVGGTTNVQFQSAEVDFNVPLRFNVGAGNTFMHVEGVTDDTNEVSFVVTDPTADRTITFQDASGTVAFTSDIVNQTITLSGDATGSGTTAITVDIAANVIGASELNVTGNGTTSQYLRSDGDGTFTWATPPNTTYSAATSTVAGLIELEDDTVQTTAANAVTTTASRTYGLQVNAAGQGVINVPWTDTTANQTITLSGDVTGSGTTAITCALAANTVTSTELSGAVSLIIYNSAGTAVKTLYGSGS